MLEDSFAVQQSFGYLARTGVAAVEAAAVAVGCGGGDQSAGLAAASKLGRKLHVSRDRDDEVVNADLEEKLTSLLE
jgi:hypothetical protein